MRKNSNNIDVFVFDGPRKCCCNLSGDRLSMALIIEVVSQKNTRVY